MPRGRGSGLTFSRGGGRGIEPACELSPAHRVLKFAADSCRPRRSVDGFACGRRHWRLSDTLGLRPMENRPAMVDIMQILQDSLTAEGIEQWLRAANRL